MTAQEMMRQRFNELYQKMATSNDVSKMKVFGSVMKAVMEWAIANRPDLAEAWLEELECTAWNNYLTVKEAEKITDAMVPKRPWPRDQWRAMMEQHGFALEEEPYYNRCALYVTMCMIGSDDTDTLKAYTADGVDLFAFIHALALNKLKDKDGVYSVREYFKV